MTLAATIIDAHALLQLLYASVIAGVGICVVYACAVVGVTRSNERRRAHDHRAATLYGALASVALAICVVAIVAGITIMATK